MKRRDDKMLEYDNQLMNEDIMNQIRSSFSYLEKDFFGNERLFFENSGGSLRLKEVSKVSYEIARIPDCPRREHDASKYISEVIDNGIEDIRYFLNAKQGKILTTLTASGLMFDIVDKIANVSKGNNIVTTSLEHPSSFDACKTAAEKYNLDLRIAKTNKDKGSVDVNSLYNIIDHETSIVSIISTSNITGAVHDIAEISKQIRLINPNTYIVVDAVQTAAHGLIDVNKWEVDVLSIAPYKMFGNRGVAYGYISERLSEIPHYRLLGSEKNNWDIGSPVPAHYAEFSEIVKYICSIGANFTKSNDKRILIEEGMTRIHLQEQAILNMFINGTNNIKGIKDIKNVNLHFVKENCSNHDLILPITFQNITSNE